MEGFWDSNVWSTFLLIAVLLGSLLAGNVLRRKIPFLRNSLIPTSVLGGLLLIGLAAIFKAITGNVLFDTPVFLGRGTATLEVITYHALALGFIASTLKSSDHKLTKERTGEVFNTGVTTVATYLIQGVVGMAITIIAAATVLPNLLEASGLLLPFGYGQGTGNRYSRVPWARWKTMKEDCGHKYMNAADLTPYTLGTWPGDLRFLEENPIEKNI